MAILTMRQAANAVGVSRSTIYRKIEEGILSLTTIPDGAKGVDTSELIRVFGEAPVALQARGSSEVQHATPVAIGSATPIAAESTIATLQA